MPTSEIREGMIGTGYTVSEGRTPEPFQAEVLGVMPDGIGPGRDMIVVRVSSPAIERAGGIWYGMSGSPIYVNGRFIGAIAYGLSFGPSTVGGVTPAEDMLRIAERPTATDVQPAPRRVELTPRMTEAVAQETGYSSESSDSMTQLRIPLSVSGAGARAMSQIRKSVEREGLPFVPYAGASASATPPPTDQPIEPGGNFAAAISYGDVTFAGLGTTSYVCDGKVLAFGHPFFYFPQGKTSFGGNVASAITIVDDPTFGPYKLATIGGTIGTLDQDRFAGIRTIIGDPPSAIPVTSSVSTADGAVSREGATDVLDSETLPFIAFIHILSNIDFTWDQIDEGSSTVDWTITGTRESGAAWELSRSNVYASEYDISYSSISEIEMALYRILYNDFEEVHFTGVDADVVVDDEVKQYTIKDVLVSKNGGEHKDVRRVRVRQGHTIGLRITLKPYDRSGDEVVDVQVVVPQTMKRDGVVEIKGGQASYYEEEYYCFSEYDCGQGSGNKIESFEDLLESLQTKPLNNELLVHLRGGRKIKADASQALDQVVSGFHVIQVRLMGNRGGGSGAVAEGGGKG